jgi:hypothetical protein
MLPPIMYSLAFKKLRSLCLQLILAYLRQRHGEKSFVTSTPVGCHGYYSHAQVDPQHVDDAEA